MSQKFWLVVVGLDERGLQERLTKLYRQQASEGYRIIQALLVFMDLLVCNRAFFDRDQVKRILQYWIRFCPPNSKAALDVARFFYPASLDDRRNIGVGECEYRTVIARLVDTHPPPAAP